MTTPLKSPITTHILNTATGKPACDVGVKLFVQKNNEANNELTWQLIAEGSTDNDGRINNLLEPSTVLSRKPYKIQFSTAEYFEDGEIPFFFPFIDIIFLCDEGRDHYHVPLLISPYGYSTYRGS